MNDQYIPIGGDFNRIFDHQDCLAMVNIADEATCILRAHLILEEVLNLWAAKLTGTDDLYASVFVPFKTKLVVGKNLGLDENLCSVLDKINEIRNRFSHRKGYQLEDSAIGALKDQVNGVVEVTKIKGCEEFHLFTSGKDLEGNHAEKTYTWSDSENRVKFVLIFLVLMLKLTYWIQNEFNARGIEFTIVSTRGSGDTILISKS